MKHRNKGFTLVEIVVSIALGSVVLAILGTMILTSSNFLSGTSDSDLDKRCVDSCVEFVRDQIEYSTDVRIIENKGLDNYPVEGEDNWHCLYIKDHVLYRDDSPVFDNSFYNHKQLEILVKDDYKNNMRVDFTYHLNDSDGEKAYGNRDTIVFLNITEKVNNEQGLYVSENVSLDANKSFSEKGNYAIYYKKSLKTNHSSDKPSDNNAKTGTVADQLLTLDFSNNRWLFNQNKKYRYGDIVYYDGYWWLFNINTHGGFSQPGTSASHWKRLSAEWCLNSKYDQGDVIIYNGVYYRCIDSYVYNQHPEEYQHDPYGNKNHKWEIISEETAKHTTYEKILNEYSSYDSNSIIKKLNNINLDEIPLYDESLNNSYTVFGSSVPKSSNGFVKIKDNTVTGDYYHYYYRIFNNDAKPGQKSSNGYPGWQEIKLDYDENSAYVKDDIALSIRNGGDVPIHFQANYDILSGEAVNAVKDQLQKYGQSYDASRLFNYYLNPASDYTESYQIIWKRLY